MLKDALKSFKLDFDDIHNPDAKNTKTDLVSVAMTEGETRAVANLAEHLGKEPSEVSLADVAKTSEGIAHWATIGVCLNAGIALNSKLERQLLQNPEAKEIFKNLDDACKLQFKKNWYVKLNLDFVKIRRIHSNTHTTMTSDKGTFMTIYAIAGKLGGYNQTSPTNHIIRVRTLQAKLS